MIIHDDKTITLDQDETLFISALLQGMLKGYNQQIEGGRYFTKEERKVRNMINSVVEELEDAEII